MARVTYYYRAMSEYIEIDLRLLRENHDVVAIACDSRWPRPFATWREVSESDFVMSWFASWHAFLPALFARLLGKPFAINVGGYDTACLPGIDYGHQQGGFKAWIAHQVMGLATRVLPISDFTCAELRVLGVPDSKVHFMPLGLDPARYRSNVAREPCLVVTTGGVNISNPTRKGLEAFVRSAALAPEYHFVVIGAWMDGAVDHLRAFATPNVTFTDRVSHETKVEWLSRAEIVVQASQHEAFGLSLAEGMLCGAVPVVTNAGSLPWVAGGTGVVIDSQSPEALAAGIRAASALGTIASQRARQRVLAVFTTQHRRAGLQLLLASLQVATLQAHEEARAA